MIKRARHTLSPELRAAVKEYYSQMGQYKISSMRLIEFKHGNSILDNVLVRVTDEDGEKITTICGYDGHQGKLYHPEKPKITEHEWCPREDEDEYVNGYMAEQEEDCYDDYDDYDDEPADDYAPGRDYDIPRICLSRLRG